MTSVSYTHLELESVMTPRVFMDIIWGSSFLLQHDFGFPDTRYHEVTISFHGKYDRNCLFISDGQIGKKMIITLSDI